ncbi:uncharacterized protein LOC135222424 [Macrobrachium nipponense]|uniref:uncharacterized protein LOC135222424 n=1 Tax=Macrobrachium nipponense TaxID=159736 RepID=UPI0030C82D34
MDLSIKEVAEDKLVRTYRRKMLVEEKIEEQPWFNEELQKKGMMDKAQKLANLTYSVIEKSCNKVLLGKTFWKNIALPSVLYGTNVVNLTDTEIEKLQRIENGVYRKILGACRSTVVAILRGEIGASSMKSRIMSGKLSHVNNTINGRKELLKKIIIDMQEKERKWWKTNGNTCCPFCHNIEEDIFHFLLYCCTYREERVKAIGLQQPYEENESYIIGKFLFTDHNEIRKESLYMMWKKRMKELNNLKKTQD